VRPAGEPLWCPGVRTAAFSADGRVLLAVGARGVFLWDVGTRRPLGLPLRTDSPDTRAWLAGDGRHVLTASGADVRLWPVPVPVADRAAAVRLCVELRTGMELAGDTPRPLDAAAIEDRRRRLEQLLSR
jgi:hypothetical protein